MALLLTVLVVILATFTAGHALVYKRDARAVIAWVAVILLLPFAGAVLYWLLAVNRIERVARRLRPRPGPTPGARPAGGQDAVARPRIARVGDQVSPFKLCVGNRVVPLEDGDAAYPEMLRAINEARSSVALAAYIFDGDEVGLEFGRALQAASARGVEVRVLVDAHGRHNRHRNMVRWLRQAGVNVAEFLPWWHSPTLAAFNLRNHRKLLVVDGIVGFTGGINISGDHLLGRSPEHPVRDLHFRCDGPVVAQLMEVFADDWQFTTGEHLAGETWFPGCVAAGPVYARAIPDGPDDHFEALRQVIHGALAEARESVMIATPYFLPDQSLIAALNTAALRGIDVDILLPSRNDHRVVQWASQALYWQLLQRGCRIWHSPPPFDHSKLMLVDREWALVGSTNWDPRSLRLNFELNIECHDPALGAALATWFDDRRAVASAVTAEDVAAMSLPERLRNGAARLLTPYL